MTTTAPAPDTPTVPGMYPAPYAVKFPDKPAMIMADTGAVETYGELEDRSLRLANHYRAAGLERGEHVAIIAENRFEILEAYHAAQRSGLLITVVNHHLTVAEAEYIFRNCEAKSIIVSTSLPNAASLVEAIAPDTSAPAFTLANPELISLGGDLPGCVRYEDVLAAASTVCPDYEPRGGDMLYSSGTTGRPKGILPQMFEQPVSTFDNVQPVCVFGPLFGFSEDSVYLSPAPLYHGAPLKWVYMTQCYGGTAIIMPRFEAEQALAAIEKYKVTHSQWVPTMFVRLLKLPAEIREKYDVSSMKCVVHAAAACPVEVKRQIIDWFGPIVWEYFTATEGNGVTMVDTATWLQKPGTVGHTPPQVTVHILDEGLDELPAHEVGTIWWENQEKQQFGYFKEEGKTDGTRHPEHPNWTTVGDMGWVDEDGFLYPAERQAYLIITGGVNIYPQEIENELALHPDIVDVAVDGLPDDELGQIVAAYITLEPGVPHTKETALAITDWAGDKLATFKLPRVVFFTPELPRTPTGKLQKRKLDPAAADAKFVLKG